MRRTRQVRLASIVKHVARRATYTEAAGCATTPHRALRWFLARSSFGRGRLLLCAVRVTRLAQASQRH
jgi:hypothetical protein